MNSIDIKIFYFNAYIYILLKLIFSYITIY